MLLKLIAYYEMKFETILYENEDLTKMLIDQENLISFITATKNFVPESNTKSFTNQFQFSNLFLYNFYLNNVLIQALFDSKQIKALLFNQLRNYVLDSLDAASNSKIDEKSFQYSLKKNVTSILELLTKKTLEKEHITEAKKDSLPKIALLGFAKAGKTSIKKIFFENWTEEMTETIKPTFGAEITANHLNFLDQLFTIVDFGGQELFRGEYFKPEKAFLWEDISNIIYVIDIQDPLSFKIANEYLEDILTAVAQYSWRKPQLTILFHKYDPDKKTLLTNNVNDCLSELIQFTDGANFYFTSIKDKSSQIALIKIIYFSFPKIILEKIFKSELIILIKQLESEIRNNFVVRKDFYNNEIHIRELESFAYNIGFYSNYKFQSLWANSLVDSLHRKGESDEHQSIEITISNNSIYLYLSPQMKIFTLLAQDISVEIITNLLRGIGKIFNLTTPVMIKDDKRFIWMIEIFQIT